MNANITATNYVTYVNAELHFKEKALEQFLDSLGIRLSSGADIREHMRRT